MNLKKYWKGSYE